MKILGIDYGRRKIGLAISEGDLASPFVIRRRTQDLEEKIRTLCEKEEIGKIIVGVSEGEMAKEQKKFGEKLANVSNLPVEFWDETLSSKEAVRKMIEVGKKRKARHLEDAFAAALILQSYLDNQRPKV